MTTMIKGKTPSQRHQRRTNNNPEHKADGGYKVTVHARFSEQSSFNHAFKRWTGHTPTAYRRSLPS
jgi:methylphosphotriester-DNA--protein-cysteine methyltransferase